MDRDRSDRAMATIPMAHAAQRVSDGAAVNDSMRRLSLHRIVITNFKNYIGEHVIAIDGEPFTCFFGRNGAGKSCVVDAIAFCLGATPQQLRVQRFANLVNDVVSTQCPSASATVALCFQADQDSQDQRDLWVKRSVDAATSQSKFSCSRTQPPTWKTVTKRYMEELLLVYGIDLQLQDRFIIRQANASALAQMSSLQLLHFCERVIGTYNLKDELSDLHRQWNEKSSEKEKLREKIASVEDDAIQCQPMVIKLQDWIQKNENITQATEAATTALVAKDRVIQTYYRNELRHIKQEISRCRAESNGQRCKINQNEERLLSCSEAINENQKNLFNAMKNLKGATKVKTKLETQLEALYSGISSEARRLAQFERGQAEVMKAMQELKDEIAADTAIDKVTQAKLDEVSNAVTSLPGNGQPDIEAEREIRNLINQIERVETSLRDAKSRQTQYIKTRTQAKTSCQQAQEDVTRNEQETNEQQAALAVAQSLLDRDQRELSALRCSEFDASNEVTSLETDLSLHTRQFSRQASKSKGDDGIQRLRESLGPNVILGRLCDQAFTDPKYAAAVNSALQAFLSYVVVRDRRAAVAVSRAFTEEKIGRVSCCVLQELDDQSQNSSTSSRGETADAPIPLCRVISCRDESTRRLFNKYGHKWVICQDVDQAAALIKRGEDNCVTLQGDLFYSDGSIRAFQYVKDHTSCGHPNSHRIRAIGGRDPPSSGSGNSPDGSTVQKLSALLADRRALQHQIQAQIDEVSEKIHLGERQVELIKNKLREVDAARNELERRYQLATCEMQQENSFDLGPLEAQVLEYTEKLTELKRTRSRLTKTPASKKREGLFRSQSRLQRELTAVQARMVSSKSLTVKFAAKHNALEHQMIGARDKKAELELESTTLMGLIKKAEHDIQTSQEMLARQQQALSNQKNVLDELNVVQRELESDMKKIRRETSRLMGQEHAVVVKLEAVECELTRIARDCSSEDESMDEECSIDQLEVERALLSSKLNELHDEQKLLNSIKSSISVDSVERAIACDKEIASLQARIDQEDNNLADLAARQQHMAATRYDRLVAALQVVNANFSRIYRLMNEDGDCYLGYSLEKSTLFNEGVTLNCKPDENHWQPFIGLSGGQQVVCAVSLMLALQASFSSPFYVCDEIDAALDTVNVQKLANLLRDQSYQTNTQFLVVSHREEMWDVGHYLVGVYEGDKSAHTVSCRFE